MSEENKAVLERLIDEVLNAGRLELIDELYSPEAAEAARSWVEPFRLAFPDVQLRTVELTET